MKCTKAIIPVAGYGTRRLPITKAVEKCMLPLLNRPIVDYVVEDCVRAGITDIYFVISETAGQLRHYYHRDVFLEDYLIKNGKGRLVESIKPPADVRFHFIEQDTLDPRYGTTIPVWLCRDVLDEDEHILVIMGDQCLYRQDGGSEAAELISDVGKSGAAGGMIGVPVPEKDMHQYGIIEADAEGRYLRILDRPEPQDTSSRLNNGSFYLFDYKMFEYIDKDMRRPHTGEYMLPDAINEYVADNGELLVRESNAKYLDCGTVEGWVRANNYLLETTVQT